MTTEPSTGRILVVDDHDASRYATVRLLKAAGFAVAEAATGGQAIATADGSISLVVLDVNLPDIDGFQVCRELRARPETAEVPVVYLSATFTNSSDRALGMQVGADGYLTHPADPVALVATVRALLFVREAQASRRAANARFKRLFDLVPLGMVVLDAQLRIMDANPAFCRLLRLPVDTVLRREVIEFLDPDDAGQLEPAVRAAIEGIGWQGLVRLRPGLDSSLQLEWTLTRDPAGDLFIAMVDDVTERRLSETRQLRTLDSERAARAEAELSNQLKDHFLATLSHELRNPLGAILGWASVLRSSRDLPQNLAQGIDAIYRNARVQSHLISDLLDFAGIRFGKMRLEPRTLDAISVVRSAVDTVSHQATERNIQLTLDAPDAPHFVVADEARLQQIVWNLLTNAIKFTPPSGTVAVRVSPESGRLAVTVTDSGLGISGEFLPRLFDRFSQQDTTKAKSFGGLGIGLTIVKHLVDLHQGTIEAHSDGEGLGATFRVTLPLADEPASAAIGRPGGVLDSVRVLVVEDGDDTRALIVRLLRDAGAEVMEAGSAEEALRSIDREAPQVLVSDIGMARQDGYRMIRKLRASGWSSSRLPAIALTAFVRSQDRAEALDAGFQVHLGKPVNAGALLAAVAGLAGDRLA
jgi:PAS domain S-box-containing protein